MITSYKEFEIEVFDDPLFTPNSADNLRRYDKVYINDTTYSLNSQHGIVVSKDDEQIASAITCASGGITRVHPNCSAVKNGLFFICCSNYVYSLKLPSLEISWVNVLDSATCFAIYPFEEDFIIHGELEITRITLSGDIKWQFGGRDIFIGRANRKAFEIIGKTIKVVDYEGDEYLLDPNGKQIK